MHWVADSLLEKDVLRDRQFIASVLLDAVETSFRPGELEARKWLHGWLACRLFLLLDISPDAALERLQVKWARIDGSQKKVEVLH
ncbi:hypothetical protein ACSSZE_12505 [Acidithiobacillus caldus]|uniref:Uncharacterized protein n=1 Tax=Acidithiobacillus caldus TaxID=33059 RepID=A0A1E7Z179_9PROT|nr:hypothetical protein BAE30_01830 [Acidithiobacillus caldus]